MIVPVAAIAVAAALHPGAITFDGVSGVKVGMTVAQAEKKVGHRIKANYEVSPPCGTATLSKRDRVYVLLDGKRIKRFDVLGTRFHTTRGIHVHDSISKLLDAYPGKLLATRNFYSGNAQYEYRSANGRRSSGRSSQRGVPISSSGGAISVSKRC